MRSEPRSGDHNFIASFTEKLKNFWEKRAAANQLANWDPLEVARIAQDLGVSTRELRLLAISNKKAADLLERRLQTLRVDPTSVDPAIMRDLQLHCAQCDSKKLCAHELDNKSSTPSWPKYCPNEQTIEIVKTQSLSQNIVQAAWPSSPGSRRGIVMTRCPETKKPISTGIMTSRKDFVNFPKVNAVFHCPYCYVDHAWDKNQTWLAEKIDERIVEATISIKRISKF